MRILVTALGGLLVFAGCIWILQGFNILPGSFMTIRQAMGAPKSRGAQAMKALADFVEEMKASGFVGNALLRHGIQGAAVAPAAA